MSYEEPQKSSRANGQKSAAESKEARLATLIEAARRSCVKVLEFEDVKVEFWPQEVTSASEEPISAHPSRDLDSVPERPKKGATPKALRLNQDYDAWTAATPGPIFEKKDT